jgi:hypothetical protein
LAKYQGRYEVVNFYKEMCVGRQTSLVLLQYLSNLGILLNSTRFFPVVLLVFDFEKFSEGVINPQW